MQGATANERRAAAEVRRSQLIEHLRRERWRWLLKERSGRDFLREIIYDVAGLRDGVYRVKHTATDTAFADGRRAIGGELRALALRYAPEGYRAMEAEQVEAEIARVTDATVAPPQGEDNG